MIFRAIRCFATSVKCIVAFIVGWLIYMVAMLLTVYDGLLSMIFATDLGLTDIALDPDLNVEVQVMSPVAVAILYFACLFPIVHLPVRLPSLK